MGKLVLFLVDGTTLDIPLDRDRTTVGRHASNDVCLPYAAVSGEHAVFTSVTAGAIVEDLGSTNGTFVNGKRTARQFLHDRDGIEIGRQKLVYLTDVNAIVSPTPRRRQSDRDAARQDVQQRAGGVDTEVLEVAPVVAVATALEGSDVIAAAIPEDKAEALPPGPKLRVLNGHAAGREIALRKAETLIGRAGFQVAAVRRVAEGFLVVPVEGAQPPNLNGRPLPTDGTLLHSGDTVDIASARIEFLVSGE